MLKRVHFLFPAIFLIFFWLTLPVQAADLIDVYRMAEKTSPDLGEARALLESDRAGRRIAKSELLPQLGADAALNYNDTNIKEFGRNFNFPAVPGSDPFGEIDERYWAPSYRFYLTQPVVNGSAWSNLSAADARVQAAEARLDAVEQELILRTVESYFGVLRAQAELKVLTSQQDLLEEIFNRARARLKTGTGDITSLHEARARYDSAESSVIAGRNRLQIARQQLYQLTHQPVGNLRDVADIEPRGPDPGDVSAWLEIARANRPVLIRADHQYRAARDRVDAARRARWPDLNLSAQYGYEESRFLPGTEARNAKIGMNVTVPIYPGGRIGADIRRARSQAAATRNRKDAIMDEINLNVETAFMNLETSAVRLRAAKQALESTKTSYEATEKGHEVGTRTIIDVLSAARALERAQRTYYESLYDHVESRADLKWAAGILSSGDVVSMNAQLREQ